MISLRLAVIFSSDCAAVPQSDSLPQSPRDSPQRAACSSLTDYTNSPPFHTTQFPDTFSNANLSSGLSCPSPFCHQIVDDCVNWCQNLPLSTVKLDYLYTKKSVDYQGHGQTAGSKYWEVSLDVIGGQSIHKTDVHWKFDDKSQKSVWILLGGKEISSKRKADTKATDDLFSPAQEGDKVYEYHIIDVKLKERVYKFPAKTSLSGWGKIRRFFGTDIWEQDGTRFVFLDEDWGTYGKHGTLRNMFGEFVHSRVWPIIGIVLLVAIGGYFLLTGGYKLHGWLMQQRELANWNGMDAVWDRIRREPAFDDGDEEDVLLDEGYRDDPDEGESSRSPRYTDEPQTMKPLPSKPLPEKPLPAVPLIDT